MDPTFTHRWIRRFRVLMLGLIFSGALNIGLIAALATLFLKNSESKLSCHPAASHRQEEERLSHSEVLLSFAHLSFRQLAALLTNAEPVEEGYAKRDLALSALVSCHHFNLKKALGGCLPSSRRIDLEQGLSFLLFPGLSDEEFQAAIRFAYLEKWPLTGEGLLAVARKSPKPRDPTLEQTLALIPEYYAFQRLFQKFEIDPSLLIDAASEGTWEMLAAFSREQEQALDLSDEKRRSLLLGYVSVKSSSALRLLLRTDFAFVLKRFNDKEILEFLDLCKGSDPAFKVFCVELLKSKRSDEVWLRCAAVLYEAASELMPYPFDRQATLARFSPTGQNKGASAAPAPASRRTHTVQEGESLWKIARTYKVQVDEIVSLNSLEGDRIRPGMILQIP